VAAAGEAGPGGGGWTQVSPPAAPPLASATAPSGEGASLAEAAEAELASARLSLSGGRAFSSRELFRWCARMEAALAACGAELPPPQEEGRLTSFFRELVVTEARLCRGVVEI